MDPDLSKLDLDCWTPQNSPVVLPFEAVLKLDQKFQLMEMAYAKKVNFHILSQIVFLTDFGPGVLGPLAPKGQNGQTYNAQNKCFKTLDCRVGPLDQSPLGIQWDGLHQS